MNKKPFFRILGLFLVLSMFMIVSAQPPFQQTTIISTGIQVEFPKFEYLEIGQPFQLNVHPFNASNGLELDNTTTECRIHGYYKNGTHAVDSYLDYDIDDGDFYVDIPADIFVGGTGSYIIYCNATDIGGFASGPIFITPTGIEFTIAEAILYGFIFLLIGAFIIFGFIGIGKAGSIAWLIFYICITYLVFYALFGVLYLITHNYLWVVPIFENIFYIIWLVMGIGFLPFIIVISLYILGEEAKATLEQDYLKQGYSPDEAKELSRKNKR